MTEDGNPWWQENFQMSGGLAFPHYSYMAHVSRSLMVRGVQLDWSGTKTYLFLLIQVTSLAHTK